MREVSLLVSIPCSLALAGIGIRARRQSSGIIIDALAIGLFGGLLGTLGYDLLRLPFALAGQRVFAPIAAYGLWLCDARSSSRFTDVTGWAYHFFNGASFGIMYAMAAPRRHWLWAVAWAFLLETIAIVSPFSTLFRLWGKTDSIAIAYWGHVGYGVPLGLLVHRWDESALELRRLSPQVKWTGAAAFAAVLIWPIFSPSQIRLDAQAVPGEFQVVGADQLNPGWLRTRSGGRITVSNPGSHPVMLTLQPAGQTVPIRAGERAELSFERPGVYQLFVRTAGLSHSSFILVDARNN